MGRQSRFSVRTDMAEDAHRLWQQSQEKSGELNGVRVKVSQIKSLRLCEVDILSEEGEKTLGKARGRYYSLSLPDKLLRSSMDFDLCAETVAELIHRCFPGDINNVLVAALGNPDITPDALGNLSASSILVTRHLDSTQFPQFNSLALCRPGVLGTSGIESAEQIKTICSLIKAQLLIVIDALAGSEADKLCRCIQISDAGISPGSGVGNDRQELSHSSLGIPVISIGIPTVIDASYFGNDSFSGMFVTPKDIDSLVREGARLIAYGINLAVHRELNISDIDALIS